MLAFRLPLAFYRLAFTITPITATLTTSYYCRSVFPNVFPNVCSNKLLLLLLLFLLSPPHKTSPLVPTRSIVAHSGIVCGWIVGNGVFLRRERVRPTFGLQAWILPKGLMNPALGLHGMVTLQHGSGRHR